MPRLQLIQGGKVIPKLPQLNQHELESIANRFLYHEASPQTLAWESGLRQIDIIWLAVEMARAEAFANGQRAERAKMRLCPPMERAA